MLREMGVVHPASDKSLERTVQRLRKALVPSPKERGGLVSELNALKEQAIANDARIDAEMAREIQLGRLTPEGSAAVRLQVELLTRIHEVRQSLRGRTYVGAPVERRTS